MAIGSSIEWTDATWNPTVGCTRVSEGCRHCYAERMAKRLAGMARADMAAGRNPGAKAHYLNVLDAHGRWNGHVELVEAALDLPLRWRKPRRIFVDSESDLFHDGVPFEFIDRVFAVMALCPQHTFQVLTKRPERMAEYFASHGLNPTRHEDVQGEAYTLSCGLAQPSDWDDLIDNMPWPLPNVWLGASVENQAAADQRIPHLLRTPAAVRFLSCEPLLSDIRLRTGIYYLPITGEARTYQSQGTSLTGIHWGIVGCESRGNYLGRFSDGYEVAVRSLLSQFQAGHVAAFHKQMPIKGRVSHDPAEWPKWARVRKFPAAAAEPAHA